ncbi:hypothetical protein PENARI_c025G12080 [Penicillium arizonense]|uniref:Zn(2)-C6 fungal-type domain-containing protein n=1 Tax=Penicillium arizonense TaxID=1835702 RepID=A0A1F5L7E1_PENAI|nr:hypothetical protein PENARI_c025G12080 [Penicillium arizonense]OGE48831.1 hypothetical protein PENARI_c025G12080 [Penicillium arizonense]
MVGVPHSNGCALCRERRIKCDEAVPGCNNCHRYRRSCPGYRRALRFQDEGPILARRHHSGSRRKERPAKPPAATSTQIEPPEKAHAAADIVRGNTLALMRQSSASSFDEQLSVSLARQQFRDAQPQLFLRFISDSFPTLYYHNRFRSGEGLGFAEHVVLNYGTDAYLDTSVCCLSSIYLARLTHDRALLKTSRQLYSNSLRIVIKALSKPKHVMSDNMLCTTIILSVFEMYAQTTPDAWVVHSDAVRRLMIKRTAAAFESGFGRFCFIAFRGFLILLALYEGKPCFLDEDEWQNYTIKMMTEDRTKPGEWSAYTDLVDLIHMETAKCPRYISETRDLLAGTTDPDHAKINGLISRIQNTSQRLESLISDLRSCISAHNERQQGIIQGPSKPFIGPVPDVFPDTGPSLLLLGAENMMETIQKLVTRLEDRLRVRVIEEALSPESVNSPPSDRSTYSTSPSTASSKNFSLPFRVQSELGNGPSKASDGHDPRGANFLDRVASSMGVLGARVVFDETPDLSS